VQISVGPTRRIHGDLLMPDDPVGLVVFAHGSGSSRHSVRNRQVADVLQGRGFATLLFDLLTETEEVVDRRTGQFRFDIGLLAERLVGALAFLDEDAATARLPVGFFGASTGAAAALVAAARRPDRVAAVVSRGGRPDLAGAALVDVRAPTLLIVGGRDQIVLDLNQEAARRLQCPHELVVVPGATHLFEEPGALDQVARLAADWFTTRGALAPEARVARARRQ
jgi:pimeloyl-ACP methyl ester carboxylesterase